MTANDETEVLRQTVVDVMFSGLDALKWAIFAGPGPPYVRSGPEAGNSLDAVVSANQTSSWMVASLNRKASGDIPLAAIDPFDELLYGLKEDVKEKLASIEKAEKLARAE